MPQTLDMHLTFGLLKNSFMRRYIHITFYLLAVCLVLSCQQTVDYDGCPKNSISYSDIYNQMNESVEIKIYHLINDNNHILLTLDSNEKQSLNYDISTCDSLVVYAKKSKSLIILYGSRQEKKDPQIGLLCDWHNDEYKGWLSLPITNSLMSK